jgi:hypothetical protein
MKAPLPSEQGLLPNGNVDESFTAFIPTFLDKPYAAATNHYSQNLSIERNGFFAGIIVSNLVEC